MLTILKDFDILGTIKVFILIFLFGLIIFSIWVLIRPDQSNRIAITPFPSVQAFIPTDSSVCGKNVIKCTSQSDCSSQCTGTYQYVCTPVNNKEIYYLGTRLDGNSSYCLPQMGIEDLQGCGTYTGQVIWGLNDDGEKWLCQCKYPSLFTGELCNIQTACSIDTSTSIPPLVYTDDNGNQDPSKVWDPNNFNANLSPSDTPLDSWPSGKPKYTCLCPTGTISLPNDPYRCHTDPCYAGGSVAGAAQFKNNRCVCTDPSTVVQSNVSGFCYPYDDPGTCAPDQYYQTCTCGNKFIVSSDNNSGMLFSLGGNIYLTMLHSVDCNNTSATPKIVKILLTGSDLANITGKINPVIVDDSKLRFQLDMYETLTRDQLCSTEQQNLSANINKAITGGHYTADAFRNIINSAAGANQGYTLQGCNSFYYTRNGFPDCSTFVESTDLNKSGTVCVNACNDEGSTVCGGANAGVCQNDPFTTDGYTCSCKDGYLLDKKGTTCLACLISNERCGPDASPGNSNTPCCNGSCRPNRVCCDKDCDTTCDSGPHYCH